MSKETGKNADGSTEDPTPMSAESSHGRDQELSSSGEGDSSATPISVEETALETGSEQGDEEDLETLREQATKAQANWAKYIHAVADLENYRKRATREKQDAIRFANESLLGKLLPVLDSFEGALSAAQDGDGGDCESLRKGVSMISTQFKNALTEAGLEEIDAFGTEFDPNFHEAVAQQDSEEVPPGHVMHQIRKGYKYRDRLLRPAGVVVVREASDQ